MNFEEKMQLNDLQQPPALPRPLGRPGSRQNPLKPTIASVPKSARIPVTSPLTSFMGREVPTGLAKCVIWANVVMLIVNLAALSFVVYQLVRLHNGH